MIVIDRNAIWIVELAWLVALLAELGHERAAAIIITREYLHSMIEVINDKQEASMMVERQAKRTVEQAIITAVVLGADRELDSSISIKSIVSHLFQIQISLSLPRSDKEIFSTSTNLSSQPRDRDAHAATTRRRTKERTAPPTSSLPLPHDHTHTRTRSRTPSQSLSISLVSC